MTKKYRLLKQLPRAEVGEIFEDDGEATDNWIIENIIRNHSFKELIGDWFEEIKEETIIDKIRKEIIDRYLNKSIYGAISNRIEDKSQDKLNDEVTAILQKYLNDDGKEELKELIRGNVVITTNEGYLKESLDNYNITKIK